MAWYALVAVLVVLLIGGYAVLRLRHHETDPVPGPTAEPGNRGPR
jgi:hypothetical protein